MFRLYLTKNHGFGCSFAVVVLCYFFLFMFNNRQFNENRGQNRIENNYNNKYEGINVHTRSMNGICCWLVVVILLPCFTLNTLHRL